MKRVSCLIITFFCFLLIVPSSVLAADSVPAEALQARIGVYRVVCEDAEYSYSGSSFIVSSDKQGTYLVTNYHVIEGTNPTSITVVQRDGIAQPVNVVGYDKEYDLCILQTTIPLTEAQPLTIAPQKNAAVGDAVYALGYPGAGDYLLDDYAYAVEDVTVTDGIISAIKRVTIDTKVTTFLQMSAAINPGSSGGPLVNATGQVVGINTLGILDAQDVFAAVSTSHLITLLDQCNIQFESADQAFEAGSSNPAPLQWIWWIIGLCSLVLILGGVLLYQRICRLKLAVLLSRRLQGYNAEEAVRRLSPVFHALVPLHRRGEAHGHINAANIFVDKSGTLRLGGRYGKTILNEKTQSYIPMEQYDSQALVGTYSDVYALAAVLYYMISCTPPPDVITRLQHDTLEEHLHSVKNLSEGMQQTLAKAMALQKEERLHDIEQFSSAVSLALHGSPCTEPQTQTPNDVEAYEENTEHLSTEDSLFVSPLDELAVHDASLASKNRLYATGTRNKKCLLGILFSGALLLGLAILLVVNESGYRGAVVYSENTDFTNAAKSIRGAFLFYRDTRLLSDFISAGLDLEAGNYQQAKEGFLALSNYRDAQNMVLECDYQAALTLLQNKKFESAKALFGSLLSYSDAETMVLECDYQQAMDWLDKDEFEKARELFEVLSKKSYRNSTDLIFEADYQYAYSIYELYIKSDAEKKRTINIEQSLELFESLGEYLDSKSMLEKAKGEIYKEAVYLFNQKTNILYFTHGVLDKLKATQAGNNEVNLVTINEYFTMINNYRDSNMYARLCNILLTGNTIKQQCASLMELWHFRPAREIVLSNSFIEYYLLGTWRGGGHYFRIREDGDNGFYSSYNLPSISGKYYKIDNSIYYAGSDEDGWTPMYTISVINQDTIRIVTHKNGWTYTLHRQYI